MRHDIQGLRAIAVLAVVIFHIVPHGLTGGYMGVDMFFVISGYVISLKIRHEVQQQHFSLINFYLSRMKRLLPTLLLVLIVSTVLAIAILLPSELRQYSLNLLASIFFVSNFILMTQDGYFDQSSENNPLLHLWSLAVEEHYYLFFPIFFIWLLRKSFHVQAILTVLLTVLLFGIGVWWINYDRDVAFYLSPLRFYQFLAGVICACYLPSFAALPRVRATLAIMSLVGLLGCFWLFNKATPSPGWPSLIPTLATVVLLHSAPSSSLLNVLLSNRLMVTVGHASYSIYLWHWPMIVYYKLSITMQIDLPKVFLLLFASITIGYLSWQFVEQPFRNRGPLNGACIYRSPRISGGMSVTALLLLVLIIYQQKGVPQRFTNEQVSLASYLDYDSSDYRRQQCFLTNKSSSFHVYKSDVCLTPSNTKPNILLVGDSHSAHLYSALQQSFPEVNIMQVSASGCKPLIPITGRTHCVDLIEWLYNQKLKSSIRVDAIVLAALWKKDDLKKLPQTIHLLNNYAPVFVVGPTIQYTQALPRLLSRYQPDALADNFSNARHIKHLDQHYQAEILAMGAGYISLYQQLCPNDECQTLTKQHIPVQWDTNHFTKAGAQMLIDPAFKPLINKLVRQ